MKFIFTLRAFTLLEMLIVLSIITILATMALPSLREILLRTEAQILRAQFIQAIRIAQQEARIRCLPVAVCTSSNNSDCLSRAYNRLLIFVNPEKDGFIHSKENLLAVLPIALQGELHWRTFPFYRSYLLFLPQTSDNGTLWYCIPHQETPVWALTLNRSGRERILYPNKKGVIKDGQSKVLGCH